MARDGSGDYALPAGNPVTNGGVIDDSWANVTLADIASALTQSLSRDGQAAPTANLPMGSYRHTSVGNSVARTDYASAADVQDGTLAWLSNVAGTDTITATAPNGMAAYKVGQVFGFITAGANLTAGVTLNINSLGAKPVTFGATALSIGDLQGTAVARVVYDGANFELLNLNARTAANNVFAGSVTVAGSATVSGTLNASGSVNVSGSITTSGGISARGSISTSGSVNVSGSITTSGGINCAAGAASSAQAPNLGQVNSLISAGVATETARAQASEATKAPTPNTGGSSSVGDWVLVNASIASAGYSLPAGGTWAFYFGYFSNSASQNSAAGVQAGGTQIAGVGAYGANNVQGFAWRIA